MSVQPSVVAIDAGGTSTRAAIVALNGELLGVGRAGAGNPISSGVDLAVSNVVSAFRRAMAQVDADARLVGSMVTMAGALTDTNGRNSLADRLAEGGLPREIEFESDVLSAWFSGTAATSGTVLVVGTGAVAGRVEGGRLTRLVDGLGWLVGDAGSGFWIGRRAAIAAANELDGRGPATSFTDEVLSVFGTARGVSQVDGRSASLTEFIHEVYRRRPVELARLAPVVLRHADDPVATRILDSAASALANTVATLGDDDPGPVVLAGGLVGPASALRARLLDRLDGRRCLTATDGLAGAATLALRHAGAEANQATHQKLVAALATLSPA